MNIKGQIKQMLVRTVWLWWQVAVSRIGIRRASTGRVAITCMAKCENDYIREWVEYHLDLGFDKIFIYDNNDLDGEHFDEVIGDYIEDGRCEVIDYRGRKCCQEDAYDDCYQRHRREYDWIAVFDIDEFLTLKQHKNVHEFLSDSRYDGFELIHLNWMCYGDNEMLDNDGRGCVERFVTPLPYDARRFKDFPENNHIKSIVRGNLNHINWHHVTHTPRCYYRCCNGAGEQCSERSPFNPYNFDVAYFRHYYTKTIGEWIRVKSARGYGDMSDEEAERKLAIDVFYMLNRRTPEKDDYARSLRTQLRAAKLEVK
jgi:hypothetical protein